MLSIMNMQSKLEWATKAGQYYTYVRVLNLDDELL